MDFVPLYTTTDSVKIRLTNKVQFQSNPKTVADGEIPDQLLGQLIRDAETEVEMELRARYAIPFRSIKFGNFAKLPDHTKRAVRVACDLKAVLIILSTDFGRGTHISGDGYSKEDKKRYDDQINLLLGRDRIGANDKIDRFKHSPPLEDLMLAASNSKADDGYRGRIINTDASENDAVSYAEEQINNPAATYVQRRPLRGV